ncbi:MAG: response regulator [Coriobacteriales bacterium]|jgi:signal transduction histidine kinase/DNA-binding response OmpR family regulator|nr:response regulator [Coriobacteriales bacterium]
MSNKKQNRLALILFVGSASILFALAIYTSVMMDSISTFLKADIQERLLSVSRLAALQVTPEELAQLDSPDDVGTPLFADVKERLMAFGEENDIVFVYYMRKTDEGLYRFIVDNDTTADTVDLTTEPIEAEPGPDLASEGTPTTSGIENYSVGYEGLLSAFAPVYGRQGEVVAVVGVDISDEQILAVSNLTRTLIILLIVSALFVVASGLTNVYLHVRRQNRLSSNLEQQKLMADISQSFISDEPIGILIEDALRNVGTFLRADRCLISTIGDPRAMHPTDEHSTDDANESTEDALRLTHLWSASEDLRETQASAQASDVLRALSGDVFPSTTAEAEAVPPFSYNDLDGLGHADSAQRLLLERAGLKSFLMAPLYIKGRLWGILTIESHEQSRHWGDTESQLVTTVSSAIVGSISRDLIEKERTAALEHAMLASQAKGNFLSNMSHEMRTPMNAITGMSTIGLGATEIERKDYCFERIKDASIHLLGIINDVLDMSKIEANKLELSYVSFNFKRMIERVTSVIGFRVEERNLTLDIDLDDRIPENIVTDDQRLAQVITNLLSNAVKFTPEGGNISLDTALVGEEDGTLTLQVAVSDTGIGISAEQQSRLFTSFEQADSGTARRFGGTGLGLAISKRIVELMGGSIWIESELGKGSAFKFTIQVRRGKDEGHNYLPAEVNWDNVRILAVDDAEETREYFQNMAAKFNVSCDTASDGEEALASIAHSGSYDIYFIDLRMPDMDGIELTRRVKSDVDKNAMVIMATATDWSEIKGDAMEAGVDRYVQKPLSASSIADCLNELFSLNAQRQIGEQDTEPPDLSAYRVLIAEDMEINREIVAALLEPTGLQMECAENGEIALRMFEDDPTRYNLIFMDMQMPEMDGLEATRRIRALGSPQATGVPIVAMTANVFREDVESCFAAGMNDHVGKPLDLPEVISVLRKWLAPAGA